MEAQKESALALRGAKLKERLSERTKKLMDLNVGDYMVIQNQLGIYPLRWDKASVITNTKG